MSYNHHQHYGQQQSSAQVYEEYNDYADIDEPAVAESRPAAFPASHPLFTREEISNTRALDPYPPTQSPQSWPPYESSFQQQPLSYAPYPSPSPFPPPRLSPPPTAQQQAFHFKAPGQSTSPGSANHRLTLAGSLDPTTGIFYRTPEHPRLRTAQACEKCRLRKAKCSGEHPSCKRCITRGLICEYAKEGRVRGPNKPKPKPNANSTSMGSPSASASSTSTVASLAEKNETTPTMTKTAEHGAKGARHRAPSSQSSGGSSDQTTNDVSGQRLFLPQNVGIRNPQSARGEYLQSQALSGSPSPTSASIPRGRHSAIASGESVPSSSRQNSLGEQQTTRPYPPDIHLDTASSLYRLSSAAVTAEGLESRTGSASSRAGDIRPVGSTSRSGSEFYHYQPQHQIQQHQQQRGAHGHDYLAEAGHPEQHNHRPPQHVEQHSYQKFQSPRNVFPPSSQYVGGQNPGRDTHSLSRVSMRTGTPQGHSGFHNHGNVQVPGENFRGQQQQHSLVPIMPMGLSDQAHSTGRQDIQDQDEFAYPPQHIGSYYHPSEHHNDHLPALAIDTAVRGHIHQAPLHHEYRIEQSHHLPQHLVVPTQMPEQIYHEYQQPQALGRAPYEIPYHGQPSAHVGASPRTASSTSSSGSPLTASSSGAIPVYHHTGHGVIATGPIHMNSRHDSELERVAGSVPASSSSSSSVSSVMLQSHGGVQFPVNGELHPHHSGGIGMEQGRHMMDNGGAAVHRGNGHDSLSVTTSVGSNVSMHGPSPSDGGYPGGGTSRDNEHEDGAQLGYPLPMDMAMR